MKRPLVSVIIPTKNSAQFLEACLRSIKNQTYRNIELLVVDNSSTDDTKKIARKFTNKVFNKGPERSAQRNYGVQKARGKYVLIIDSDMELQSKVVQACVNKIEKNFYLKGLVIPEESFGEGFWARCKKLERSFYVGVGWMEATRFFDKTTYQKVGGYDENMVSGEDWDLSQRVKSIAPIGNISEKILHNEGKLSLRQTLKKKYYYAGLASKYIAKNVSSSKLTSEVGPLQRYKLFFSKPRKLLQNPFLGLGMLFMKTLEFLFGGFGYYWNKNFNEKKKHEAN